ncbi:MAG: cell division transport system permease protein [Pseudohongiellaceae bacterium]
MTSTFSAPSNRLQQHVVDLKQAWQGMLARPVATLATLLAIATTLLVPILLLIISSSLAQTLDQYSNSPQLTAYLVESSNENMILHVSERLLLREDIGVVEVVPRARAFAEFANIAGFDGLLGELEINPLPDALIILALELDPTKLESLAKELAAYPEIDLVQLDVEWIKRLQGFTQLMRNLGLLIGLAALIGFFLVIANTTKLIVQQSEDEIRVLKLIGAPDAFILRPLLYSGLLYGLCAAVFSLILQSAMIATFVSLVDEFLVEYNTSFPTEIDFNLGLVETLFMLLASSSIGFLAAGISAYREVLKLEP